MPAREWDQPFDLHAISAFLRDGERVFHAYSTYARGADNLGFISSFLHLTPLGRQEPWEEPKGRATAFRTGTQRLTFGTRHRPRRCGVRTRLRPLGQAPSDAGRTVSGVPRCLISEDTSPPRPADRVEDKACARSPVHKPQQEGSSRHRKRPLTCINGSGGRI